MTIGLNTGLQVDWTPQELKTIRDSAAYWSRSDVDDRVKRYSHWFGYGRLARSSGWNKAGMDAWARFIACVAAAKEAPADFAECVEWGSGGGANAGKLLQHFSLYHGADISRRNLKESVRMLSAATFTGRFIPTVIEAEDPWSVVDKVGHDIDYFFSVATFQHFPGRRYAEEVVRVAHHMLRPGGLAMLQVRHDDGSAYYASKEGLSYCSGKNAIRYLSFRPGDFAGICRRVGFEVLRESDPVPRINYVYYDLRKS